MTTTTHLPDGLGAAPPAADALRLVFLVRRRRRLKRTVVLTLLALPVWIAAVVTTQAVTADGSPLWDAADEWASPGLGALTVLFLLALVALLGTGLARRPERKAAAHVARRLVPLLVGRRADGLGRSSAVEITGDRAAAAAFASVVDRRPKIGYGVLIWFLGSVLLALATGWQVPSVWQANHGTGGETYTFGVDATLDHTEPSRSGTDYYLSTPEGVTISQSGRPEQGERFIVTSSGAYAVGGHTWVLVGGIAAAGAASALVTLLVMTGGWVRESARRAGLPHPDPAVALDEARAAARTGHPLELRVAGEPAVRLSFDRFADLPAGQVLTRHRRHVVVGTASVVVVVGAATALVATGAFTPPPDSGDVRVPALAGVVPGGMTRVYWSGPDVYPGLFTDLVGRKPAGQWDVDVSDLTAIGRGSTAVVSVFRLPDGVPAATAAARWTAFLTSDGSGEPAPPAVTGLPAGWTGALGGDADGRRAEAVTAQGDWLLDVVVQGLGPSVAPAYHRPVTTDDQLAAGARALTAAVTADGIDRFATQTRR